MTMGLRIFSFLGFSYSLPFEPAPFVGFLLPETPASLTIPCSIGDMGRSLKGYATDNTVDDVLAVDGYEFGLGHSAPFSKTRISCFPINSVYAGGIA